MFQSGGRVTSRTVHRAREAAASEGFQKPKEPADRFGVAWAVQRLPADEVDCAAKAPLGCGYRTDPFGDLHGLDFGEVGVVGGGVHVVGAGAVDTRAVDQHVDVALLKTRAARRRWRCRPCGSSTGLPGSPLPRPRPWRNLANLANLQDFARVSGCVRRRLRPPEPWPSPPRFRAPAPVAGRCRSPPSFRRRPPPRPGETCKARSLRLHVVASRPEVSQDEPSAVICRCSEIAPLARCVTLTCAPCSTAAEGSVTLRKSRSPTRHRPLQRTPPSITRIVLSQHTSLPWSLRTKYLRWAVRRAVRVEGVAGGTLTDRPGGAWGEL